VSTQEKPPVSILLERAQTVRDDRPVTIIARSMHPPADPLVASAEEREFRSRYEMSDVLGEGGMGEVRLCRDGRIGRDVAIKVIRAGQGSRRDLRARFLREVQVQGQLEHPSIVPVYDLGVGADGATYFTMKRVRGLTLTDILSLRAAGNADAARDYTLRKLLAAFGSVCLAVEFAHARKVIHRDLKPSNIMLGDFGEVYVLDWGIAKITNEPHEEYPSGTAMRDDMTTAVGTFIGTLGYLSPEQFEGLDLDGRSDVYSLGAVLFEMLTLTPLHQGSGPQVAASTMKGADARCSVRAPSQEVPPELEQICVTATMLDPKDRYATARQLYEAVQRYLDGDRDTEQRRALAAKHAEAGLTALSHEGSRSVNEATALLELGRALALDPANETALDAIVGLLVKPPTELAGDLVTEVAASNIALNKTISRGAMISFAGAVGTFFPLLVLMGVKNWTWTLVFVLAMTISTALCYFQIRRPRSGTSVVIMLSVSLGYVALGRLLGPLILIPSVAVGTAMVYASSPAKVIQRMGFLLMASTVFLPLFLEYVGVFPRSYVFRNGVMTVVSQLAMLREKETIIVISFTTLFTLLSSWLSIQRVVNALKDAEERLCLQAWQLRQLVPARARHRLNQRTGNSAT
jgi:hypothetical protein